MNNTDMTSIINNRIEEFRNKVWYILWNMKI